ncbi:FtsB family cell division protein, partial [Dermacoccus barathri]
PAPSSRPARSGQDRSRPSGSTRPSLRQQFDAPIERRRRANPRTVRRALALGALFALMLVVLTPTLRSYLQQRSEIADLRQQKIDGQKRVEALEAQKKRWEDPAYIKKQASQRLGYAMPGQKVTVYVDDRNKPHAVTKSTGVANATTLSSRPWYGQLWGSVKMSSDESQQGKK